MPILQVIFILAAIGVITWVLITYVPMAEPFKKLIIGVAVVAVVLWLVALFFPGLGSVRLGK